MARNEKKKKALFEMKSILTGLVLIEINNKLHITEEKIRELDYMTMKLSKIKYREKRQCCRPSNDLTYATETPGGE